MFGKPTPAPAPAPSDPIRIPTPDDPDVLANRRLKMQEEFAKRQGRESTVLAQGAAGPTYSRTTLG